MDDFEGRSRAFMSWLPVASVSVSSKISLVDLRNQNAGRGIVAIQNVVEDEVLFSIPRTAVLTAANSDLSAKLPQVLELDSWTALILVMIYEYARGEDSPWKPYLDILPPNFDTLMFWSQEELANLQASAVVNKIGRDSANQTFKEQIIPLIRENQAIFFPRNNDPSTEELLALAHRMGSTIMAYAFDIERSDAEKELDEEGYASEEDDETLPKGMVPLADMLNADADRNNARLFYEEDALVMKAIRPIAANEEIYNDYGPLPRSDLLRRYGYITSNYAKYDVVEIPHTLLVQTIQQQENMSDAEVLKRMGYLEEEEIIDTGYDISRQVVGEPLQESFSPELLTVASALLISDAEFERLQARGKLPKIGPVSAKMAETLELVIQTRAQQYATTVEADEEELGNIGNMDIEMTPNLRRQRMALEVRLGEKDVLREAREALQRLAGAAVNSGKNGKKRTNDDVGSSARKRREA